MGIEPTTRSLGSYCSTTELHPLCNVFSMTPDHLPQNFRIMCSADAHPRLLPFGTSLKPSSSTSTPALWSAWSTRLYATT
jgi:hypothetical protein